MRVDNQLCEAQDLATQMERVAEARLFTLLCRQRFDRFQIEIVVEMEIIEILAMNKQVEHVVALSKHLQAGFNPVERR